MKAAVVLSTVGRLACNEESARSRSRSVADVLESKQRRAQLAQIGCQVVDPVLGVLSSHQKHDLAKQVLQSDHEAGRRHASKILGLGSAETTEDAWWRASRVSRQDAAIVLVGLGVACASPVAAISEWDGTGRHYESCPSDQLWRQWVSHGRKYIKGWG